MWLNDKDGTQRQVTDRAYVQKLINAVHKRRVLKDNTADHMIDSLQAAYDAESPSLLEWISQLFS